MPPNKKYEKIQYVYAPNGNHVPDKFSTKLGEEATRLTLFISFCKGKGASIFSGIGVSEYRFAVVEIAQC